MPGGDLAAVEGHRGDLALADAHLDPAAHQARIERVVAGVGAHVGIGGYPQHLARIQIGGGSGAIAARSSARRLIGRQRGVRCGRSPRPQTGKGH